MKNTFLILFLSFAIWVPTTAQEEITIGDLANATPNIGSQKVKIFNTNTINSPHIEFSPAYYQNGIVFASSRKSRGERDEAINETFFELFYADLDGLGMPLKPDYFSNTINSQKHEGPVTFNQDWSKMFFTRNNLQNGLTRADNQGYIRLKIYQAEKGEEDWENIVELPFNDDSYSACHPSLSANDNILYFSSDMPGGFGGMDLWKVEKLGEEWSEPINLGAQINTPDHEVFPFIHHSGYLFFSSNGHQSIGGLDLFMVDYTNGPQGTVISLGTPFNTTADDLGLILNNEGTSGFFTSNREGGKGKDDIYRFEAEEGIWGKTKAASFPTLIAVYDADTKQAISAADIRIFERTEQGFIGTNAGLYEAVLMPRVEGSPELVFKLIRRDDSQLGKPDLMTDNQGESNYAFRGAKNYLLLVSKEGYASKEIVHTTTSLPIATKLEIPLSKVSCATISGVLRDRNTKQVIPDGIVRIWSGCDGSEELVIANAQGTYSHCLAPGCEYMIKAIKEGYIGEFKKISATNSSGPFSGDLTLSPIANPAKPIGEGTVIVLENIYYDFNKSAIRRGAARELDEVVILMNKFPSMTIELSAHTDSRGSNPYNDKLSRKRADSAKSYLVAKGIPSNRIEAIGYGEERLRNNCSDGVKCTEEQHQYNRRTEIKVINIDEEVDVKYRDSGPEKIDRM